LNDTGEGDSSILHSNGLGVLSILTEHFSRLSTSLIGGAAACVGNLWSGNEIGGEGAAIRFQYAERLHVQEISRIGTGKLGFNC
jgi:hypothetical protein